MAFAIMRAKKLKTMGSVAASLQHCYRERETPNAIDIYTCQNLHLAAGSSDQAMGILRDRLPEKRRKDAVLAVEYVMTASPEWWGTASREDQKAFFSRSVEWLADKYGRENIITATVHRDESTPHLSAFVVPLTADGRLSAKQHIGDRKKMSHDQTTFADRVADLGLIRGIEGSRATHSRVGSYYGAIEMADRARIEISPGALEPKILKKRIFTRDIESPEMIADRLSDEINRQMRPVRDAASESARNAKRARELGQTLAEKQKQLKALQKPFIGLSKNQVAEVLATSVRMQQQNQQEQKRQQASDPSPNRGRGRGFSR